MSTLTMEHKGSRDVSRTGGRGGKGVTAGDTSKEMANHTGNYANGVGPVTKNANGMSNPGVPPGGAGGGGGGGNGDENTARLNGLLGPADGPAGAEMVSFTKLFTQNWLDVFTYCMVFGSFGMGVACLGPTLLDLGCQTGTDLREMSWVFFVQLLMTSIGSIVAGVLANRFAVSFLLFLSMVGMPLTMFIIPSCTGLAGLVIVVMIMGLCMGCIDCIANLGMINLFQKNVSPFLQALHFSYGLGAFISPMVAEPFLLNVDCTPYIDGYSIHKTANLSSTNPEDVTVPPSPSRLATVQHESRLKDAFYIIGTIQLPVTLLVAIVVIKKSQQMSGNFLQRTSAFIREKPASDDQLPPQDGSWLSRCFTYASRRTILITLLASATMFIFDGLQSSYGGYVYSYSLKSVPNLKHSEGAVLNACFWGTFAAGRLFAIVLASKFTAGFMLLWDILGACFSMTLTVILRTNHIGIYVGTCFLGLFLSSASPTVLSLTEQFIDINPSITSTIVVFSGIGETLCPVIVGNLFVNLGPPSFLVFCFIIVILSLLLFICLFLTGRETEKYSSKSEASKRNNFCFFVIFWEG